MKIIRNQDNLDKLKKRFIKDHLFDEEIINFIEKNEQTVDTLYSYYECAIMEVETKFKVLDKQYSMYYDKNPIESISTRLKSKTSLMRKIKRYGLPLDFESIKDGINDIAGVRIVCSFIDDIYELEKQFLAQDDIKLLRRKDYIKEPKESGYRSLHLIVEVPIYLQNEKRFMKVEVQMRTIAMDFWAALEHKIRYKKNISEEDLKMISEELKDCAESANELDLRMQKIHEEINIANDRPLTKKK